MRKTNNTIKVTSNSKSRNVKLAPIVPSKEKPKRPESAMSTVSSPPRLFLSIIPPNPDESPQERISKLEKMTLKRKNEVNTILKTPREDFRIRPSHVELDYKNHEETGIRSTRAQLCIETLTKGCIDAFINLFELSHRQPPIVDEITKKKFIIPDEKLKTIKSMLINAERYRRSAEYQKVYNLYIKLADYFESEKDFRTSLYFHKKGKEIAKQSADSKLEAMAYEQVGLAFGRRENYEQAIRAHESQLSLSEASKNEEEALKARRHLVKLYEKMAIKCEEKGDSEETIKYYNKALTTALATKDKSLISACYYILAKLYKRLQDFSKSVEHFEKYEEQCLEESERASALEGIGGMYEQNGDLESALKFYKKYLKLCKDLNDCKLEADACDKVGTILLKMKRFEEAVSLFERNYELAIASGESEKINSARIKIGVAKGNSKIPQLLNLVNKENIDALLDWKNGKN